MQTNKLHLQIVHPSEIVVDEYDLQAPVFEGPHGCDIAWKHDGIAYTCLPHRWIPGNDASYIEYQSFDVE